MDYSENRMDEVQEQDLKEVETKFYENFFPVNPQMGESGQVIPNTSLVDSDSYSRLQVNQSPVGLHQKFPYQLKNTPEVDDSFLSGLYPLHTPKSKKIGSYATHIETPTSQQELRTFLSIPEEDTESIGFTKLETSLRIPSNTNFEEDLSLNENDTINGLSFHSPVGHQVVEQHGEIYPRGFDYQQLSHSLQTPPCGNSQYQVYSNYYGLTPPECSDQNFPSISWLGHDSPSLAISEGMMKKKESKNSFEQCSLKAELSCESTENNEDTLSEIITKSIQPRHYSSVADISSAYQRRKQLNRHKMGQYRSVSPCLQIRKRRSAKGLIASETCGRIVGKGLVTSFVNYTPEDSEKILTGVAPSGSNKTKARRDREALINRQKLSQAALRAVEAVGGDISGLVEEEFFIQN